MFKQIYYTFKYLYQLLFPRESVVLTEPKEYIHKLGIWCKRCNKPIMKVLTYTDKLGNDVIGFSCHEESNIIKILKELYLVIEPYHIFSSITILNTVYFDKKSDYTFYWNHIEDE